MTLMIDRLDFKRFGTGVPEGMHPPDMLSRHTPAFEITNVADLCYRMDLFDKGDESIVLHPEKFPNVAPPFRSYWMEWRPPAFLDHRKTIGRFGLWCVITDNTDDEHWSMACAMFINERKPRVIGRFELRATRDGHVFDPGRLHVFPDAVDDVLGTYSESSDTDDVEDALAAYQAIMAEMSKTERQRWYQAKRAELVADAEVAEAEVVELTQRLADRLGDMLRIGVLPPLLLAHSLLGCKNVQTDDLVPNAKLSRAAMKRRGQPLVKFKTLTIKPMGGHAGPAQRVDIGGGQTALHLVRGHFKTFTPERPLFGTRAGTYWWSPNVRGNAEQGVVVKDYKVDA